MRQKACSLILVALVLAGCQHSETLPDQCYEKPDSGMCRAAMTRYYYDPASGQCRAFIWGGCGGNVPFDTLDDCAQMCKPTVDSDPMPEAPANRGVSF